VRALTLLVPLTLLACDKGDSPAPRTPAIVNKAPTSAVDVSDALALMPAESDVVITLDIAALRKSPLFAKYRATVSEFITPGFAGCAYDPFDEITTVTAGIPMSSTMGVFVMRGVDRDKTLECLRTSKVETNTAVSFDGDIVHLRNKSGALNLLTFVDAKTAVMQGSEGPTKETLGAALAVGAPLRKDSKYLAAEKHAQPGAVVTIIGRPDSPGLSKRLEEKLGPGRASRGLATSIHFTDVVTARFMIEMVDPADAQILADGMKPQLESFRQFLERYDIQAKGPILSIDAVITEQQIQTLVELVKSLQGGN
jgi:hypothetical protein